MKENTNKRKKKQNKTKKKPEHTAILERKTSEESYEQAAVVQFGIHQISFIQVLSLFREVALSILDLLFEISVNSPLEGQTSIHI